MSDQTETPKLDWIAAEQYLKDRRREYTEIGTAGLLALNMFINPLLVRFERGERTPGLHAEIMSIAQ